MKIYNDLTKRKEEFVSQIPNFVSMYVCGPTVYGPPHVGHGRSYINFDIVFRFLSFLGNKVKYVQNITDVGHLTGDSDDGQDKILKQAIKEHIDPYEVAYKYEVEYFKCMDMLNVKRPSISSRATGFIPDIIDMVQTLINKGYAYVTEQGNVYYDVRKFKQYGKLSNRSLDNNFSGERVAIASDKHANEDFALWKNAEPSHIMKWNSPWGLGYPGWHIECSVMSKKFLGKTLDIHGGGLDNIFPHHECEIAQSEIANDAPFVNYFMHNNLITVDGVKMGKSLGNFITLEDLFKEFSPMAVRYFILQFTYRAPIDFNKQALTLAQKKYNELALAVAQLRKVETNVMNITNTELKTVYDDFVSAMEEDFNTALAIVEINKIIKMINNALAEKQDKQYLMQLNFAISTLCEDILGFKFDVVSNDKQDIPNDIVALAQQRWNAKQEKNWEIADSIRKQLEDKGYLINDSKSSYEIVKKVQ